MSHEFKFENNVAIIVDKTTGVDRFHQPFNPATGSPWANEETARTWAYYEYGYLLTEVIDTPPNIGE